VFIDVVFWTDRLLIDVVRSDFVESDFSGAIRTTAIWNPTTFESAKMLPSTMQQRRSVCLRQLADGGQVTVPLEQTLCAQRFGAVVDRFGMPWAINCGEREAV
jgi:uncharacterized glyoxalase superfamily protein PhnB